MTNDIFCQFFTKIEVVGNYKKHPTKATIAEFANTADPDEMVHNEPSHLSLKTVCRLAIEFSTQYSWN